MLLQYNDNKHILISYFFILASSSDTESIHIPDDSNQNSSESDILESPKFKATERKCRPTTAKDLDKDKKERSRVNDNDIKSTKLDDLSTPVRIDGKFNYIIGFYMIVIVRFELCFLNLQLYTILMVPIIYRSMGPHTD